MRWQELREDSTLRSLVERRAFFISAIRDFFVENNFLEVETPYLQNFPNLDPNIVPFCVDGFFLHTSPEYGMKRLLAAGFDRIFQICRVFRKERIDRLHLPEFTMLEWYRKGKDYLWLVDIAVDLIRYLSEKIGVDRIVYRGRSASLNRYEVISLENLFISNFGVSIGEIVELEDIVALAESLGVPYDSGSWENTFNLIYLNLIEPELARMGSLVFVIDYPASMAAMSRLRSDKPWLCERVELMVCGVELMNGYSELTDPVEQMRRLELQATRLFGTREGFVDEDFVESVACMGEAAGAALGIDRLFMLLAGEESIERVVFGW